MLFQFQPGILADGLLTWLTAPLSRSWWGHYSSSRSTQWVLYPHTWRYRPATLDPLPWLQCPVAPWWTPALWTVEPLWMKLMELVWLWIARQRRNIHITTSRQR